MKAIVVKSVKYGELNVLVDDEDYFWLIQWKWGVRYQKKNDSFYVIRSVILPTGKKVGVIMSRLIMGVTDRSINVDHKDNNTLNNTKNNLRISTIQQNGCNKRKLKRGQSIYKGVYRHSSVDNGVTYSYWRSRIRVHGKLKSLGLFKEEIDAALAYNCAAKKYHGEFAFINQL